MIKVYGTRHGKVIKDQIIPKKDEVKIVKKRGRPKKAEEVKPKEVWKPTKDDLEKGKAILEKDGWRGLIKVYGISRGKVIKDQVVPKKKEVNIKKKRGRPKKADKKERKVAKKEAKKAAEETSPGTTISFGRSTAGPVTEAVSSLTSMSAPNSCSIRSV